MSENDLATKVIGICIEIHKQYGPGLLESVYEEIFCHEWAKTGIAFTRQQIIPFIHDGVKMKKSFRADVIIDKKLILDFKSSAVVNEIEYKRVKTYCNLTFIKLALVINFYKELLKQGIKRILNGLEDEFEWSLNSKNF